MNVKQDRLKRDIEALGRIGRDENGVTRLPYTKEDTEAREFVSGLMRNAGLEVRIDAVGSIFGLRPGKHPEKPVIMFGSHIDSVPGGGQFDGCLGALGGIEVMRALNDACVESESPLLVVAWADEEAGWGSGTFSSRAFAGQLKDAELSRVVRGDRTLASHMESAGLSPWSYKKDIVPHPVGAYVELHIEQGGVLDYEGVDIGVVTGIVGITRGSISVAGVANHAGTTPMRMRDDALVKAARIIQFVHEEGRRDNDMVATIGKISVSPGAMNVIPGNAEMVLELRSMSDARVGEALRRIGLFLESLPGVTFVPGQAKPAVFMTPEIMQVIQQAAESAGFSRKRMHSGAGHDAMIMATIAPTGMIFVPSKNGISHSKHEWTDWDKCAQGVEVLYRTVLALDDRSRTYMGA